MLIWRLSIGIPVVAALVGLCYLDAKAPAPGLALIPFFLICVYFLCKEALLLLNAGGIYPRRTTFYFGVFGTILLCWASSYNSLPLLIELERTLAEAPSQTLVETENAVADEGAEDAEKDAEKDAEINRATEALETALAALRSLQGDDAKAESAADAAANVDAAADAEKSVERRGAEFNGDGELATRSFWAISDGAQWKTAAFASVHTLLAIAAGVLIAFVGEMLRFKLPGGHLINLTGAVFAIVYVGLLGSFLVMLRIAYGVPALVSMIIVAKLCDVGAYTVGRLIGRHKMAPSLSPGKTIEGAVGGIAFAILGAWLSVAVLFPLATGAPSQTTWVGVVIYGLAVGLAGMLGDLAESLIKRDVMRKDSGTNVPGFGGFLDIYDSLLLAAPVAFGLWAFHVIK
ncbi:MAG: phosphatidate cytidylyltransferase [Thermoguttaceae bacterium]|nr:phosphatidate cytidylyltransferase [Thermoguttaceae bacterium]